MAIKTQQTQLYFVDPEDDSIVEVACIGELTGMSATRDEIDTTCLADEAASYEVGLVRPGPANFPIKTDPNEPSHVRLNELFIAGTKIHWAAGWSDGFDIAPTGVDTNGMPILPNTRTWLTLFGSLSDFPFDFAQNSVVESTLAIRTSGMRGWIKKSAP